MSKIIKIIDDITSIKKLKQMFNTIDDNTFNELIKLDPTYQNSEIQSGKYGEWILRLYNKNQITKNDFYKVTEYLNLLINNEQRLKALNISTDINTYKNLSDLNNSLSKLENESKARKNNEVRKAIKNINLNEDAELFMSTENFDIYIPLTYEASVKLGRGTSWCTATTSKTNDYDNYTSNGNKLYILINKTNKNIKYQWNTKEKYIADKYDNTKNEIELCIKYPDLLEFFNKFNYNLTESIVNANEIINGKTTTFIYTGIEVPYSIMDYITKVIVKDGVTTIKEAALASCFKLIDVEIPSSVTTLADDAFSDCINLKNITLNDNIKYIGDYTFYHCPNLIIKTNNDYVINYCKENNIKYQSSNTHDSFNFNTYMEIFDKDEQSKYNIDEEGYDLLTNEKWVRCGYCNKPNKEKDCYEDEYCGYLCPTCTEYLRRMLKNKIYDRLFKK